MKWHRNEVIIPWRQTVRSSHTFHTNASEIACFWRQGHQGISHLWWDSSRHWPEWQQWPLLIQQLPQSNTAAKRLVIVHWKLNLYNTTNQINIKTFWKINKVLFYGGLTVLKWIYKLITVYCSYVDNKHLIHLITSNYLNYKITVM